MVWNYSAQNKNKNPLFKKKESKSLYKKTCLYNRKLFASKQCQKTQIQIIMRLMY